MGSGTQRLSASGPAGWDRAQILREKDEGTAQATVDMLSQTAGERGVSSIKAAR